MIAKVVSQPFQRVHVEPMCADDLHHISRALHPGIRMSVSAMVRFNRVARARGERTRRHVRASGSPWEFNLRTFCAGAISPRDPPRSLPAVAVERLFGTLFLQRLRTYEDRARCGQLFEDAFGYALHSPPNDASASAGKSCVSATRASRAATPRCSTQPNRNTH